jgi:hypothetical protein
MTSINERQHAQDRVINRALYVGRKLVRAASHGDMAATVELDRRMGDVLQEAHEIDMHRADTDPVEVRTGLPETEVLVAKLFTHYKRRAEEASVLARAEEQRRMLATPSTRTVTLTLGEWDKARDVLNWALANVDPDNSWATPMRKLMEQLKLPLSPQNMGEVVVEDQHNPSVPRWMNEN